MTGEIRNPVRWEDIEPDMTEAEKQFAEHLGHGNQCFLGEDIPKAHEAGARNTIRSEVIRFFAFGGDEAHPVLGAQIFLWGAWISGGALDLTNARVSYALHFIRCHFDTRVDLVNAECAALSMEGSHLAHGLICDGLRVKGGVFLRRNSEIPDQIPHQDFSAAGVVRFVGARIGRDLDCTGGNFQIPEGDSEGVAFGIDRAKIEGSLLLNDGFSAMGEVRLSDAKIGGDLNCMGGTFDSRGEVAFRANRAKIEGDAYLGNEFHTKGGVDLRNAKIGGGLHCSRGIFEMGLNAMEMEVGETLFWNSVSGGNNAYLVNLAGVRVRILADGFDVEWGNFTLSLDGFTYNYILDHRHVQPRINWLSRRSSFRPFSPLPYEQAAKVLFEMGHASDAREILLEKERLQTKDKRTPWYRKIGRWFWDEFAGYGYRLRRTVAWSLAVIAIGWGVFSHTAEMGGIVPHQPAILASQNYQEAVDKGIPPMKAALDEFPEHPKFNPLVFSADVFIPVFALHQEPSWYPVAQSEDAIVWLFGDLSIYGLAIGAAILCLSLLTALAGLLSLLWGWGAWLGKRILRRVCPLVPRAAVALCLLALGLVSPKHWYWLEIGFGWILTSLFLLSITGLLRPRQSSGEKD